MLVAPRRERHAGAPRPSGGAVVRLGDEVHQRGGELVGVAVSGDGEVEGTPWFAGRKMREFDAGRKRDKWWRVCKKR